MNTYSLREKLHQFIETAEERKLAAIYTILEEEIQQTEIYSDEFKTELDNRYAYYKNGGKMITPEEVENKLAGIMNVKK